MASRLWWPEDRSWSVATEVDFRWTYVGGTTELINAVLETPKIEPLSTELDHGVTLDSDTINR